ncbi:MAG: NFACT family protein, partial [Anaerolineae bacterium]|nr:NFACT family protein [Anaerolineae bacterium]MDW8072002.1 NFACT RNA binding domain-containing protein [Anaerolineae bacterium]
LDVLSIGLELYAGRRYYLLLSAHPQLARVLLVSEKLRRGPDVEPPILLLLRKWLRGARLMDVTQPPWERILIFHFEGTQGHCRLIVEMMDRYSNLVLVSPDGRVLDAIKRIGPEVNRKRVTLPGQPYQMPPPQSSRYPPTTVDWSTLLHSVSPEQPLHTVLTSRLLGVSPTLAREIVARATGNPLALVGDADPSIVGRCTAELLAPLANGQWQPHIGLDEHGEIIAWAPYPLLQCVRSEPVATISEAMERFFASRIAQDAYAAVRREVQNAIDSARRRVEQALAKVRAQIPDEQEINWLREAGELLLIHQHTIAPGAEQAMLPDYEGTLRHIPLDPTRSIIENAQLYFQRYRKAARAAHGLPMRLAELEAEMAFLEQLTVDLRMAQTRAEIDAVREELAEAGWISRPRHSSAAKEGPRRLTIDGFTVYVGRNARQNEEVTFRLATSDDLWLHIRGQPGPHVVIKSGGREVPQHVIEKAARLALGESIVNAPVDVTRKRFVRRMPGGRPGMVVYHHEQTLWVKPDEQVG